ncbi:MULTISPECIES: hypothetical protein [Gordonibacter]|uniref:hypothetical protein n=1 Tax=Gordonibacter TaxID=644652 RepID=UPI000F4BE531|nr:MULTISPECIES: hypothetical protein [Gordonibacter]MBS6974569.1 hypothetical protein [Eggerthellaceae bacterium]MCB6561009.1 hypothetical protein [Gordonibacter urolithinfaciens]MDN4470701.1 hypothetical protein [Gordonibacter sp. RACS_AR68]ROT90324.1 hypothetical protein DMP13_09165 [Gordonibacter urolithinfaciens]
MRPLLVLGQARLAIGLALDALAAFCTWIIQPPSQEVLAKLPPRAMSVLAAASGSSCPAPPGSPKRPTGHRRAAL